MNSSSQLVRTTPAITSNFKLLSSQSTGLIYMEAFESNSDLSAARFKHFKVPELSFLSERVAAFFRGVPAETGFQVKNTILPNTGVQSYHIQVDDMYYAGVTTVKDTWHAEEFEAFAPLLVNKDNLPDAYIVLRIDGPGYTESTPANFRSSIMDKAKVVHFADLSKDTAIGRFLSRNYTENDYYLQNAVEIELDTEAFSRWNGIDYYYGGYTSKSFSTAESLYNELTPYTCEKFITDGFKMLGVAWTGILNMSFLFDDTPAKIIDSVPVAREWSQNRYMGFYVDSVTEIIKYSPYVGVKLKISGIYSHKNVFYSGTYANMIDLSISSIVGNTDTGFATITCNSHGLADGDSIQITNTGTFDGKYDIVYLTSDTFKIYSPYAGTVNGGSITDPYADPTYFGWKQNVPVYIKDGQDFLPIDRVEIKNAAGVPVGFKYMVVSDKVHEGDMDDAFDLTQLAVKLRYDNSVTRIEYVDDTVLDLDSKHSDNNDVLLIEVDGEKYRLQHDTNGWYINTDQLLYTDSSDLNVLNANGTSKKSKINTTPTYFTISRCTLCDIRDLDTDRTVTDSSRYEHEKNSLDTNQDPKLYAVDETGTALYEKDYTIFNDNSDLPIPSIPEINTYPVTYLAFDTGISVNSGTDLFTSSVPHGLREGQPIYFTSTGGAVGTLNTKSFATGVKYYVLYISATTFKVSDTVGGTAMNITTSSTTDVLFVYYTDPGTFYLPTTSEYIASGDLFRIDNNSLTDIWRINPVSLKWGFTGSMGRSDSMYMFNNSARTLEYGNREPLSDQVMPDRSKCNMDWFYTIGSPATLVGSASDDIEDSVILPMPSVGWEWDKDVYHSLCVTAPDNSILRPYNITASPNYQKHFWRYNNFNLQTYADKDCPFDYFEWFFTQKTKNLQDIVIEKWSTFNDSPNEVVPCETLFRGLLLQIWDTTTKNPLYKEDYTIKASNEYNGYKFAAILTKRPTTDAGLYGTAGIDIYLNKVYKNMLLAIYVYVPVDSMISAEFVSRDSLYDIDLLTYATGGSGGLSLNVSKLTLKNIIHKINEPDYYLDGIEVNKIVVERKREYGITSVDWSSTRTTVVISSDDALPYTVGDYVDVSFLPTACGINATHQVIGISDDSLSITIVKPTGSSSPSSVDHSTITTSTPFVPFVLTAHEPDTLVVNTQSITRKDVDVPLVPNNSIVKTGYGLTFSVEESIAPSIWNGQPIGCEFVSKTTSRWESESDPNILRNIRRFKGGYVPVSKLVQVYSPITLVPTAFSSANTIIGTGMTTYTYGGIDMLCIEISDESYTFDQGTVIFITESTSLTGADEHNLDRFYSILDYVVDAGVGYIIVNERAPAGYVDNNTFVCAVSFYDVIEKNAKFDETLYSFGQVNVMESRYFGDTTTKSNNMIYPMIDEVGMTERQRYLFKSSWDKSYFNLSKINKYNAI